MFEPTSSTRAMLRAPRTGRLATLVVLLAVILAGLSVPASANPGASPSPANPPAAGAPAAGTSSSAPARTADPTLSPPVAASPTPADASPADAGPAGSPTDPSPAVPSPAVPSPTDARPTASNRVDPKPAGRSAADPTRAAGSLGGPSRKDSVRVWQTLVGHLSARQQRLLASGSGPGADRSRAARAAAAAEDDRFVALAFTNCAPTARTGEVRILAGALTDEPLTVDYVVVGHDGVAATGFFVLDGGNEDDLGTAEVTVTGLAPGGYRVDFFDAGGTVPVTSQSVEVLACVTVGVSCQSVSFTNPAANPTVEVVYYRTDDDDGDNGEEMLDLGPGETTRVHTSLTNLSWIAGTVGAADSEDDPLTFAQAGEGDQTIEQDCVPDVRSTAAVGCSTGGGAAAVNLRVDHPVDQRIRYQILSAGNLQVASGDFAAGGEAYDVFSAVLPGAGHYRYQLYLGSDRNAYDSIAFQVLTCLATKVSCEAVTFINPSGNPAVTVTYGSGAGALDLRLRVAGGHSARQAWHSSSLAWNAARTPSGPFVELAGGLAVQRLTVPQGCSGGGGSGDRGSGDGGSGPLAATGGPIGPLGMFAGLVLTLAGVAVLTRRRLS